MYKIISCTLVVLLYAGFTLGKTPIFIRYDPDFYETLTCDQCPPGSYMEHHCTSLSKTECTPCPPQHYADLWNTDDECHFCSAICKELQVVTQECNATHNRVCECKEGYFLDVEFCVDHKKCPPGYGVVQPGTPHRDTVCSVCPKGMFSNVTSASAPCQTHTNCKKSGLVVARKGSSTEDTLCQEHTTASCEIDVTLCEEALFRFRELPDNWLSVLIQRLPGLSMNPQQIDSIKQINNSEEQSFYLFKLYKSQNKEYDSFRRLIQDLNTCENGVSKIVRHLNVSVKHMVALMQSLPGKTIKREDIKATLKKCDRSEKILKLLSLWRNKNGGDTIKALKQLKTNQLEKTLRRQMKKLGNYLTSVPMYRLYQKIILEINGNQTQLVKMEMLL